VLGMGDRTDDAVRLALGIELEAAVHAGNDEVEARQHVFRIVQRAVHQNIGFDAFEDSEFLAIRCVQTVDGAMLLVDVVNGQPLIAPSPNRARRTHPRSGTPTFAGVATTTEQLPEDRVPREARNGGTRERLRVKRQREE
jgi:hypothetical protein